MTSTQIYALIFLAFNAAFLYWTGYKTGLADGRSINTVPAPGGKRDEALTDKHLNRARFALHRKRERHACKKQSLLRSNRRY